MHTSLEQSQLASRIASQKPRIRTVFQSQLRGFYSQGQRYKTARPMPVTSVALRPASRRSSRDATRRHRHRDVATRRPISRPARQEGSAPNGRPSLADRTRFISRSPLLSPYLVPSPLHPVPSLPPPFFRPGLQSIRRTASVPIRISELVPAPFPTRGNQPPNTSEHPKRPLTLLSTPKTP